MLSQEKKKPHRIRWVEAEWELAKRWAVPANAPTRQKTPGTP